MSEVRLLIREAGHDWCGTVHGSVADCAIAALGADPVSLPELEAAFARFENATSKRSYFANLSERFCDEPYDAGIVVIDLAARLVVVDSTYSSPEPVGEVCYHDGHSARDKWLRYHLADDWLFSRDRSGWQAVAEQRRRERAARPVVDSRSVFYGRPLLEFLARETFNAFAGRETLDDADHDDAIKNIHAAWLLTPRDDLGGVCPRDIALEWHNHLMWDLQDQAERWSLLEKCPPGLDEHSFAYRYGGFGTHELVKYYDLVRDLLWSCRERLTHLRETWPAAGGPEALTAGDFLTSEVPRLERLRDEWLDSPDPECHGRTPRSIIERERARLPEGMSGHDAIVDPDCPCCQMLADMPGTAFWHLDGCNMDDDFAFDIYHRTREEWEAEQRKWEEHRQRWEAEAEERRRLGVTHSDSSAEGEPSVWSSSFCVGDTADLPLGVRLFGIGGHLAELIVGIRSDAPATSAPEAQHFIDRLNRDFGNLREILQTAEPSLTEALIEPVISRFGESLTALATARPDLSVQCESLTDNLARFLEPQPPESTWESGDLGVPF